MLNLADKLVLILRQVTNRRIDIVFLLPKSISLFLSFAILLLFFTSSCTGLNLRTWPIPVSPNTHPSESYAGGGLLLKGGFIYHKDSTVLYSGSGNLEKTGKSCSQSFLYLVAIGSSRIYEAKVEGGINRVGLIEEEILGILGGVYHRHCTIVYGESG